MPTLLDKAEKNFYNFEQNTCLYNFYTILQQNEKKEYFK